MKAGIVGATGYGGIELLRLLTNHPQVKAITLFSSSQAGEKFENIYPQFRGGESYVLHDLEPEKMKEDLDVIFLATPSGVSSQLTPQLQGSHAKVIDLSGDLRIKEPATYEQWYKKEAAPDGTLGNAVYGLPEWNQEQIEKADLIANPGCYPTATLLGLGPVVKEGLVKPDSIVIDAKSGVSGAGKNPNPITHFAHAQENFQIYKVNQHQHIPEIEQQLTIWDDQLEPVTFSTHLVPMTRGIMATIYLQLKEGMSEEDLRQKFKSYYEPQPFVRVRESGGFPCTKDVYGSNFCDIGLTIDARTKRVTIVSVIDNLMKGAASQAVQNMNLVFQYDERTGLAPLPVYP
ncbi:N-acetyl-gamma-glutamyl-phosphate reductase [Halobacillus trueperi]|uniref:N-acetyl-gamma-glutamyl-phosphate reductase n=2 Tax=Halobacillus TaxID=45667 RepID=A0A1H0VK51_HALAD|nr:MULTISPECIES: N-acetyl-gamma-glutamyl-phosphate reductase [Halobacillus]RDY69960.1 N-acetyl-gamma-glutamyl-phosphate reductase [Halobacillus trueperi]SDP78959.1 N-acetyl-gamma-glutamyl-phosphate reductase [Halobacillus aidingensis]